MEKQVVLMGKWAITQNYELYTVLGSCVSVCFYCAKNQIVAMTHYVLPTEGNRDSVNREGGDILLEKAYRAMLRGGVLPQDIEVFIFGGGEMFLKPTKMRIGEKNIEYAKEWIKNKGLKVKNQSVGGPYSRKVFINPKTGSIRCHKIHIKAQEMEPYIYIL